LRLKVVTTSLFVFGGLLLLLWPVILGPRPTAEAERTVIAQWGVRALVYFFVTSITFLSAAFCSVLIMRANRMRYLEEMKSNVKELIEGSLEDHGKPPTS